MALGLLSVRSEPLSDTIIFLPARLAPKCQAGVRTTNLRKLAGK